jgi:hypothetical protein
LLVAPVALVWVEVMDGEDFAGGEVGDEDLVVVGEGDGAFAGVGGAGAEVVHAAGPAEARASPGEEDKPPAFAARAAEC